MSDCRDNNKNYKEDYKEKFIDFLVKSGALTFGDFITKSGRKTPYFINTGNFNTGSKIAQLGYFYAAHIQKTNFGKIDTIFGPAYKGVPLCVSTAAALYQDFNTETGFTFNRKEAKEHGDGGSLVGTKLENGTRIIIVEDVITAGTTLKEVVPLIQSFGDIEIVGVVIAVDRMERGSGNLSAVSEAERSLGLKVYPLATITEIVKYLSSDNNSGFILTSDLKTRIQDYLDQYGANQ